MFVFEFGTLGQPRLKWGSQHRWSPQDRLSTCQGHRTHEHPAVMDSAARHNWSMKWAETFKQKNKKQKRNPISGSTWTEIGGRMVPSCYDVRAACRIITMRRQVQLPKTAIKKKAVNKPHNNSHSWCFSSFPVCQLTSLHLPLHPPTTPLLLPLVKSVKSIHFSTESNQFASCSPQTCLRC